MTHNKVTIWKSFTAAAAVLAMNVSFTGLAEGQQFDSPTRGGVKVRPRIVITDVQPPAGATRGSVKVRSRLFNPFDVTAKSRLTIDPFGFFSVLPSPAAAAISDAAIPLGSSPLATEAVAGTSTSAASSVEDSSLPEVANSVRPPFRPPVRSPFRPPPRPPF